MLQSPYTALWRVAEARVLWLPVDLLATERFPTEDIDAPLLIYHGQRDDLIPPTMSRQLFDLADEPKHIVFLDGEGHNVHWPDGAWTHIEGFMSELFPD